MAVRLNAEFEKVKLLLVKQAKYEKLLLERHEVKNLNFPIDKLKFIRWEKILKLMIYHYYREN